MIATTVMKKNKQIVSDEEMELLQINAMSQLFFQKIQMNSASINSPLSTAG